MNKLRTTRHVGDDSEGIDKLGTEQKKINEGFGVRSKRINCLLLTSVGGVESRILIPGTRPRVKNIGIARGTEIRPKGSPEKK